MSIYRKSHSSEYYYKVSVSRVEILQDLEIMKCISQYPKAKFPQERLREIERLPPVSADHYQVVKDYIQLMSPKNPIKAGFSAHRDKVHQYHVPGS